MFLISLKAGGFGLNLTEADYCFLLDPWWNPATEAQAIDRTHRIGQTRNVMVYRLIARDTIEEKVMALQARKAELFASVIDDGQRVRRQPGCRRYPRAARLALRLEHCVGAWPAVTIGSWKRLCRRWTSPAGPAGCTATARRSSTVISG